MFTLTPAAAEQVREAAKQSQAEGMPLRIAAKRADDGSIEYGMGFADDTTMNDLTFNSEGVSIVIAPSSIELLSGATMDFVEIEPGQSNFIFLNPNDPNYTPPEGGDAGSEHHF